MAGGWHCVEVGIVWNRGRGADRELIAAAGLAGRIGRGTCLQFCGSGGIVPGHQEQWANIQQQATANGSAAKCYFLRHGKCGSLFR
jgi:hypothetical protein